LEGVEYSAAYYPLYDPRAGIVGGYVLSLPIQKPFGDAFNLGQWSLLVFFSLALTAGLATLLLVKRFALPMRGLAQAVSRIERGDLATPIGERVGPEVAPLAREVEAMRRSVLRVHIELAIERSLHKSTFRAMADGVLTTDEAGTITSS